MMNEPITHDQVREVFARLLTRIDAANVKHYENHMGECQIHVWDNDGNPIGMICAGAEFLDDEGRMIARFAKCRYDNGGLRKFATVAEFEAAVFEALAYTLRGKKLTDPEIVAALEAGKRIANRKLYQNDVTLAVCSPPYLSWNILVLHGKGEWPQHAVFRPDDFRSDDWEVVDE